jgi:probable HAF family extracellular repeat protein
MRTLDRRGLARIWLFPLLTLLAFLGLLAGIERRGAPRWVSRAVCPAPPGLCRGALTTVADLGTIEPIALNDRGQVAGYGPAPASRLHAVLWEGGRLKDLGTLPGFLDSYGISLNSQGQVTGYADDAGKEGDGTRRVRAFLWANGKLQDLGSLPNHELSLGLGINGRGEVTGIALPLPRVDAPNPHRVFHWRDGRMRDLGNFGDDRVVARAINNRGQIAGQARRHAVLWEGGTLRDLGTLPGTPESAALALNDRGQVVGFSGRAFLWDNGQMRDLGTLGGRQSAATAINEAGQAVGVSQDGNGAARAFVWAGGRLIDLNTLLPSGSPWVLEWAAAINRDGRIAGGGRLNGSFRGFLLTRG